jgi:hypothetical protein
VVGNCACHVLVDGREACPVWWRAPGKSRSVSVQPVVLDDLVVAVIADVVDAGNPQPRESLLDLQVPFFVPRLLCKDYSW